MNKQELLDAVTRSLGDKSIAMSSVLKRYPNLQQDLALQGPPGVNGRYHIARLCIDRKMDLMQRRDVTPDLDNDIDIYIAIEMFGFLNCIPAMSDDNITGMIDNQAHQGISGILWAADNGSANNAARMQAKEAALGGVVPNFSFYASQLVSVFVKGGSGSHAYERKLNKEITGIYPNNEHWSRRDKNKIWSQLESHIRTLTADQVQHDLCALYEIMNAMSPRLSDKVTRMGGLFATPLTIIKEGINLSRTIFPWNEIFALNVPAAGVLRQQHALFTAEWARLTNDPTIYYRGEAGIGKRCEELVYLCRKILIEVYNDTSLRDYEGADSGGKYKRQLDRWINDFKRKVEADEAALPDLAVVIGPQQRLADPLENFVYLDDNNQQVVLNSR